jgi:hypothetical protein
MSNSSDADEDKVHPDYVAPHFFATFAFAAFPCICGILDGSKRAFQIFLRLPVISLLHLKIVWAI